MCDWLESPLPRVNLEERRGNNLDLDFHHTSKVQGPDVVFLFLSLILSRSSCALALYPIVVSSLDKQTKNDVFGVRCSLMFLLPDSQLKNEPKCREPDL